MPRTCKVSSTTQSRCKTVTYSRCNQPMDKDTTHQGSKHEGKTQPPQSSSKHGKQPADRTPSASPAQRYFHQLLVIGDLDIRRQEEPYNTFDDVASISLRPAADTTAVNGLSTTNTGTSMDVAWVLSGVHAHLSTAYRTISAAAAAANPAVPGAASSTARSSMQLVSTFLVTAPPLAHAQAAPEQYRAQYLELQVGCCGRQTPCCIPS